MKQPNLLLIQTDQQKASSLDIYNREINYIRTESIAELAEEGVVFDNAYCPYPLCVPSRISMMCGQYPSSTGHIGNGPKDIAGKKWTLFDQLKAAGDQPFACWLSICDPHEPYQAPRDIYDRMADECIGLYPSRDADFSNRAEYMQFFRWYFNAGGPIPDNVQEQLIRVYLAMCKNIDRQLGRVFDCLKAHDLWENTLIVYTSDHGDLTGELGLLQKFNCAYNGSAKVPMIMSWPGKTRRGRRVGNPVNLVDLPATVCAMLGVDPLPGDQGTDLSPALLGDAALEKKYTVTVIPQDVGMVEYWNHGMLG